MQDWEYLVADPLPMDEFLAAYLNPIATFVKV
jgi:hypothetical protein